MSPISHRNPPSPVHRVQHASARPASLARPADFLGADPDVQVVWQTTLAEGLSSSRAAQVSGGLIDVRV